MDNLANAFSSLQNSQMRRKKYVFLPFSKIIWSICTILYIEGFIRGFKKIDVSNQLHSLSDCANNYPNNEISNKILGEFGYIGNSQKNLSNLVASNQVADNEIVFKKNFRILVYLKYLNNKPILDKISKISLQGRRIYTKKTNHPLRSNEVLGNKVATENVIAQTNGNKVAKIVCHEMNHSSSQPFRLKILSTSKGILSDKNARFLGVGGEVLCEIF